MKRIGLFVLGVLLFSSVKAQNYETSSLTDTISFVPIKAIDLGSMPVNIPNSHMILSEEFSFEMMTGGILSIFLSDRSFNTIAPFSLRDYNPTSVSDFNSYIYRNYFLIDKQSVINDW